MPHVRRGRPSEIRTLNRLRIFALTASPVLRQLFPSFIRASAAKLASWGGDDAAGLARREQCLEAVEVVGNLFGEIVVAGVRVDGEEAMQPCLPFGIEDGARILDPDCLTGSAAIGYCFDMLRTNLLDLWIARCDEAMDTAHPAHSTVYVRFGKIFEAAKRRWMNIGRDAATDGDKIPPPEHDDAALEAARRRREQSGARHGALN